MPRIRQLHYLAALGLWCQTQGGTVPVRQNPDPFRREGPVELAANWWTIAPPAQTAGLGYPAEHYHNQRDSPNFGLRMPARSGMEDLVELWCHLPCSGDMVGNCEHDEYCQERQRRADI